jgi:hypothetical protein
VSYTWGLFAPPTKVETENLQVISSMQADIAEIKRLLEIKSSPAGTNAPDVQRKANQELSSLIAEKDLDKKYPLGFAIFYSDGRKLLSYGKPTNSNVIFDPSTLIVTNKDKFVCLNLLPIRINGRLMDNIRDTCFGGNGPIIHAARVGNVGIDIESLGSSTEGAAWVIGVRPA